MVTRMRQLVPDLSLRTTFITGHPGEGAKEFGELYDFVEWRSSIRWARSSSHPRITRSPSGWRTPRRARPRSAAARS